MKRLLILALLLAGCSGGADPDATGGVAGLTAVPSTQQPLPSKVDPTDSPDVVFDLPVVLSKRTTRVARNANASVTIKTTKGAECGIDVQYASGSSTAPGLEPKTASSKGAVTWKWRVDRNAKKGTVPIVITCTLGDRSGRLDTAVKVV